MTAEDSTKLFYNEKQDLLKSFTTAGSETLVFPQAIRSAPIVLLAALGVSAAVLSGCSVKADDFQDEKKLTENIKTQGGLTKSYYPPSEDLKKFADDNPDCPLWSDWESLCSYTKQGGEIECHDDPSMRVVPSEPFCHSVILKDTTQAQLNSMNRFCDEIREYKILIQGRKQQNPDVCMKFRDIRPFNGKNMASVNHPWCGMWVASKKVICRNPSYDDIDTKYPTLPTCDDLAKEMTVLAEFPGCAEHRLPNFCEDLGVITGEVDYKKYYGDDGYAFLVNQVPLTPPVKGLYCSRLAPTSEP